jgi:hypothetical protein
VNSAGRGLGLLALALVTVAAVAASSTVAPGQSGAQAGAMHNCPPAGKWSIAVWQGASGTAAADALAVCGEGSVAAAYSLDSQTGAWSRWFAGKPDVSNLAPMGEKQGLLALGGAAAAAAAGGDLLVAAQGSGQLHNCPPAGKWAIAVWDGADGTAADDALAACGADAVAAAYSLDAQTGAWSRWFAGKPDVSNLPPLGDVQGLLALGAAAGATPTPSPSPTPTPGGPAGPAAGATYVGETSQGLLLEFDVAADGLGIDRVKFGFEGLLNGEPCQGLLNMNFGSPQTIVDNSFTINDGDYTMTGRFDSATAASGDLQVHIPDRWADPGCFGDPLTWTASVQ